MRYIVTGSRIYAPTSDVGTFLDKHRNGMTAIAAIGSSPASNAALQWGIENDIPATWFALDRDRSNLYQMSAELDAYTVLFACRAPNSPHLTDGISQILSWYQASTARYDVVESPIPGRICELITTLNNTLDRYVIMGDGDPAGPFQELRQSSRRKRDLFHRIITIGIELNQLSGRLKKKMEDETGDYVEWERSLRTYEAIEDTLTATRSRISGIRLDGE